MPLFLVAMTVAVAAAALALSAFWLVAQLQSSIRLRLLLGKYVRGQNDDRPPLLGVLVLGSAKPIRTSTRKPPRAVSRYVSRFDEQLAAAGILLSGRQWLRICAMSSAALALISGILLGSMVVGLLTALAVAAGLLTSYLPAQIRRRQHRFANDLPRALQSIAGGLRSGQSVNAGIDGVAQLQRGEVAFQFQRAMAEVQFGSSLDEALGRVSARMKSEDLKWFVLSLEIHRELGGPLSEVVDALAQTMTARSELRREVRVVASEGRLSAMVLGAIPFIAFAALYILRPDYLSFFWTNPSGFPMLGLFAALMLAGCLWLRAILKDE